jgi:hypothetical protein
MRLRWYALGAVVAIAVVGCGRSRAPEKPQKASPKTAVPAERPLPDWAPRKPSREFLRASQLIRPESLESRRSPELSAKAQEARLARIVQFWTQGYELLGSLDDGQLQRYFTEREIRIPLASLAKRQRALVDAWLKAHPSDVPDMYRLGATKDLSNVDFGFADENSRGEGEAQVMPIGVDPSFWVKRRDGKVAWMYNGCVGYTYQTSKSRPHTLVDRTAQ